MVTATRKNDVINIRTLGGFVNMANAEGTIANILKTNPIERISIYTHTSSTEACSGCGAMGVVYQVLRGDLKLNPELYKSIAEQFDRKGFNTRQELEAINARLQGKAIKRILSDLGSDAVPVVENLDLAGRKFNISHDAPARVIVTYPGITGKYREVAIGCMDYRMNDIMGVPTMVHTIGGAGTFRDYFLNGAFGEVKPGIEVACNGDVSKVGARQVVMLAFSDAQLERMQRDADALRKEPWAKKWNVNVSVELRKAA